MTKPTLLRLTLYAALLLPVATSVFAQKPEAYVQQGPQYVCTLCFSPDGRLLVGGDGEAVRIYDLLAGREVRSLMHFEVRSVVFSPDGKTLATAGTERKQYAGTAPYSVRLWNAADGTLYRTLSVANPYSKGTAEVRSLSFSPSGATLVAGCAEGFIAIWNLASDSEPRIIKSLPPILITSLSPDGKTIASGHQQGKTSLWDLETGRLIRAIEGDSTSVNALAFSPDGKILATGSQGDKVINLWDAASGSLLRSIKGKDQIFSLAFEPAGKTLAIASGYSVRVWDVETGNEINKLGPFYLNVRVVIYSPDGKTLASGSYDQRIILWDSATGKPLREFTRRSEGIDSVWLLLNGQALAVETSLQTKVWHYEAGEFRGTIPRLTPPFLLFGARSPDLKLVAGAIPGGVTILDGETGKELRKLSGHHLPALSISFSPDGKMLATGGGDGLIKIWNVANGKNLQTMDTNPPEQKMTLPPTVIQEPSTGKTTTISPGLVVPVVAFKNLVTELAFSPDGRTLASAIASGSDDDRIKLWDVATGRLIRSLAGNADFISAIAFDKSGKMLASGDDKGTIKLWNIESGEEIHSFSGHTGRVSSLLFAPRDVLISGGWDAKVKLWDLTTRQELVSLIAVDNDDWLVISPDGLFDGSPGAWSQVLWRSSQDVLDAAPMEIFFSEYFYPNLLADLLSGKRPVAEADIKKKDRRQPAVSLALAQSRPATDTISNRNITVRVELEEAPKDKDHTSGSGARDVRLFRNGSLVKVWRGDVLKGSGKAILEAPISLVAGENRLTVYAFNNDNIKSADATLVVKGARSLEREGTAYVIAIGVNQYQNKEFDLKYAVPDARSFGEEFQRAQNALGKFAKTEVITLLNSDATKASMLRALGRLSGKDTTPLSAGDPLEKIRPAQPEDAVVIYFSGHGTAEQNRFYLIPHDLGYAGARDDLGKDEKAMKPLLDHSLSDVELEQAFEKIDAGQLMLVIDACHSGQALESDEKRRGPMNSRGLAQLAYEKGMYILTASESYQVAIGSKKLGHGYLTYALVEEGLKTAKADEAPRDGQVLIREWLDYSTKRVPDMQNDESKEIRDLVQPEANSSKRADQAQQTRQNGVQRPRVFYRREQEAQPMIITRP